MSRSLRAVFLDKDGTLVPDLPYNVDPCAIELAPGAGEALRRLQRAGFVMVVVSNQSGVARGYFEERDLEPVRARLEELLARERVALLDFLYCPHHPEGTRLGYALECTCRKPAPGLLDVAAAKHGIDLAASWMVGDILNDIEAGRRAGCRTVLVDNGGETEWRLGPDRVPHVRAIDLGHAAASILAAEAEDAGWDHESRGVGG